MREEKGETKVRRGRTIKEHGREGEKKKEGDERKKLRRVEIEELG